MAHYAKVENTLVTQVIVAEAEFFDTFVDDTPGQWLETKEDGSIRKNHAGIGFTYDATRDAFYGPQPYSSWTLDESTCQWVCPVTYPVDDKVYNWNETDQTWDEV